MRVERDFVAIAKAYALRAESGHSDFCQWARLACARFLRDLQRAEDGEAEFYFSEWHARDACRFLELCPHVEGVWDTPTIVLHESHVFATVNIFGFRNVNDHTRRFSNALLGVARKNAKALALDTPIPTPTGWSTMGELKVGDKVMGANGRPCNVVNTSEVYNNHQCYQLEFSNSEKVVADAGHLWLTTKKGICKTRSTEVIADSLGVDPVELTPTTPLALPTSTLLIDPYIVGMWLGASHKPDFPLCCHDSVLKNVANVGGSISALWKDAEAFKKRLPRNHSGSYAQALHSLRIAGWRGSPHIPGEYLRSSVSQRTALLKGLVETSSKLSRGKIGLLEINAELSAGVKELLATLGLKSTTISHYNKKYIEFSEEGYDALLNGTPNVRTPVTIKRAYKVATVPTRCIMVDSPDHQFLFGRTMLPTHNSTWAAGVMLYCLSCEGEVGPQVISAATTGSQARIIFNIAKKMVLASKDMRAAFGMNPRANDILVSMNQGEFKPINAKASSQDGLNPSATAVDEIHAHIDHALINVLKSAAGARRNPLFLYTTTEGYENPGPWSELRQFLKQVLQDVIQADHFFGILYCLDKDDDEFDPKVWIKANPLMDVNPLLAKEIAKEAIDAKQMPGKHAEFKIKRCNRQSSIAEGLIDLIKWDTRSEPFDEEIENLLAATPCYGGLDLASTRDIAAFRLTWKIENCLYTRGWRWVPKATTHLRTQRGTVSYAGWVEEKLLIETEGDVTDYDVIEAKIMELKDLYQIQTIAYDRWNAQDLVNRLVASELPMREFIQGPKSYHPAMQYTERMYCKGNLYHEGDKVLKWMASNLVARYDVNMNMAPNRLKSADKIDDMVALYMSVGALISDLGEDGTEPTLFFVN